MEKSSLFYVLIFIMTIFGSLGSALFKTYALNKKWLMLFMGLGFYGSGSLLNIYLLGVLPYSTVVISNGLTFIWTMILSSFLFKERIHPVNICGVILICLGLFFII